tara:strand:+ start:138 stop:350 length:213 start_codon:yes stop_codon:yes gene_type:complete
MIAEYWHRDIEQTLISLILRGLRFMLLRLSTIYLQMVVAYYSVLMAIRRHLKMGYKLMKMESLREPFLEV